MKKFAWALLVAMFFLGVGVAALALTPSAEAAGSTCWPVDECNVCCRGANGKVICTQRACV
jgi:hypothetical protein